MSDFMRAVIDINRQQGIEYTELVLAQQKKEEALIVSRYWCTECDDMREQSNSQKRMRGKKNGGLAGVRISSW